MWLFDEENPIIHGLFAEERKTIEDTWRIINRQISETGGIKPSLVSAPIVRTSHWGSGEFEPRFVVQWMLPRISQQTMDSLEELTRQMYAPNAIQGRRTPQNLTRKSSKYITISGGRSERMRGYLLTEWGCENLRSTGTWVCRKFQNEKTADREIKRNRQWLYTGPVVVEIREKNGVRQLDFAEQVIQTARTLSHNTPLPYEQTVYNVYRALSKIGLQEKTEQDIAGLDEIIDFMKWTLFAPCKNERAAEYFQCKPESVLLAGVKGTGKTLIAQMLASKEYNALFVPISAVQLTKEKYVSKGDSDESESDTTLFSAVQELQSRTNVKVCLHCDDIEAAFLSPENVETEQHLATNSTLLNKLSGIKQSNTILSGSTNNPYLIDDRFMRFGRIGYCLHVPLPQKPTRDAILAIHTHKMPLAGDVKITTIAEQTENYTPAALAEICNRAALYTLQRCATQKGQSLGINPFEALGRLTPEDWKDEKVTMTDFARAHGVVEKYAKPEANAQLDREIKKFCDEFNTTPLGFKQK